jgi:hypothetical protein
MNEYFNICHEYIFISFSIVAISVNLDLTLTLPGEVSAPHPQTLWLAPSLAGSLRDFPIDKGLLRTLSKLTLLGTAFDYL